MERADLPKDGGGCTRVLDIGCGDGFLLAQVSERFPDPSLHGLDAEQEAVRIAAATFARKDVAADVHRGSAYDLPYTGGTFGAVVMTEVIEHLNAPSLAVAEAYRVLQEGGTLFVTTPHRQPGFDWDPDYHAHEFNWAELARLLEDSFETVTGKACFPMNWIRFWRRGLWERVAVRCYSRLFGNPMKRTASEPSVDYGQIIALCQKGE
jgi:ubiquinone/menaquinone biosynthesis C-methylase UbiE